MDAQALLQLIFGSGLGVDIAIAFIAAEFVFLLWRIPAAARSSAVGDLVLALGPGVCLMLALRCALTDSGLGWIAFWLIASLPRHIGDMIKRTF